MLPLINEPDRNRSAECEQYRMSFNNVIYGRYTQMFTIATGVSSVNY